MGRWQKISTTSSCCSLKSSETFGENKLLFVLPVIVVQNTFRRKRQILVFLFDAIWSANLVPRFLILPKNSFWKIISRDISGVLTVCITFSYNSWKPCNSRYIKCNWRRLEKITIIPCRSWRHGLKSFLLCEQWTQNGRLGSDKGFTYLCKIKYFQQIGLYPDISKYAFNNVPLNWNDYSTELHWLM